MLMYFSILNVTKAIHYQEIYILYIKNLMDKPLKFSLVTTCHRLTVSVGVFMLPLAIAFGGFPLSILICWYTCHKTILQQTYTGDRVLLDNL